MVDKPTHTHWDNAVAESYFATLEKELLTLGSLQSRTPMRIEIADYIETYYNTRRRNSYFAYVSPIEFELRAS